MSALRHLHTSSISGVTFADIDNVFDSEFDIYKIIGTNWKLTTSQGNNLVYVKFLQNGVLSQILIGAKRQREYIRIICIY